MKVILAMGVLLGASANALHYLNCSSADGSVRVVEKEIWGANPTGCYFNGRAVKDGELVLDSASIEYFNEKGDRSTRDFKHDFVVQAKLSSSSGAVQAAAFAKKGRPAQKEVTDVDTFLLCHEVSTSAMDLVAPSANCKISRK